MGVSGIDILFDGDNAGREGAEELEEACEKVELSTRVIKLREGSDPGGLSDERIQKLRVHLYG